MTDGVSKQPDIRRRIADHLGSIVVNAESIPWKPTKYPGVDFKLLYEDESTGLFTGLFRWAPGSELPYHEHAELEQTFVLEGSVADDECEVFAGGYVARPAGSKHIARSPNGCINISFFLKPNRFIESDGSTTPFER